VAESDARTDAVWRDLEVLASTPLPRPRLRRRAARFVRLALMVALPIVFGGVEDADLRAAGALSLDRLGLAYTAVAGGAIVMGERARRSWDRTGAQTEANMRAILWRRREARRAVTPR
jgi:hypothetical protein